jgi:hypothetical protein
MNRRNFLVSIGLAPFFTRAVVENDNTYDLAREAKYVEYPRDEICKYDVVDCKSGRPGYTLISNGGVIVRIMTLE